MGSVSVSVRLGFRLEAYGYRVRVTVRIERLEFGVLLGVYG